MPTRMVNMIERNVWFRNKENYSLNDILEIDPSRFTRDGHLFLSNFVEKEDQNGNINALWRA